jgi:protein subunit release factor A
MRRIIEITPGEGGDHAKILASRLSKAYLRYIDQAG